jgi:hypothetical protein
MSAIVEIIGSDVILVTESLILCNIVLVSLFIHASEPSTSISCWQYMVICIFLFINQKLFLLKFASAIQG